MRTVRLAHVHGEAVTERAVRVVDPATDPRWDAYVERHPRGLVYHHSRWLAALSQEYPRSRQLGLMAATSDGVAHGVLPLQWTKGAPFGPPGVVGRRLSSLPRTPVAGPLADDQATAVALLAEAARHADDTPLQIKLREPLSPQALPGAAIHPWREAYVIELSPNEADVRFGSSRNHARIKWAVNKARKAGLTTREATSAADVSAWYPLYLEALRFNAVPPRPLRLFLALWHELAPRGMMTLVLAEDAEGSLVAGSLILELGATAFYAFNGVRRRAFALRPNDLVQWEAIHRAARDGRREYDLGEVVEHHEGLADFKRKWGAEPRRLHRLYLPPPVEPPDPGDAQPGSARQAAERLYKRLPLRVTSLIGTQLYRYL
jgi:Acetyltransferase (GNAT) domain